MGTNGSQQGWKGVFPASCASQRSSQNTRTPSGMFWPQSLAASKTLCPGPIHQLPCPSPRPPTCGSLLRLPPSHPLSPEASPLPDCLSHFWPQGSGSPYCRSGVPKGGNRDRYAQSCTLCGLRLVPHLVCMHRSWLNCPNSNTEAMCAWRRVPFTQGRVCPSPAPSPGAPWAGWD